MTTTTAEYWSVIPLDGVEYPLQTLAKNISSWGNERQGVVPLRGEDVIVPWIPGDQEVERVPGSRIMPLEMWVIGRADDGTVTGTRQQQFQRNWRTLQRIFWNQGKIFTLRKRFYDESGTLQVADARARYADGMSPAMMGQTGARFSVDLKLADPFFYGAQVAMAFDTSIQTAYPITVLGDYLARKVVITATADATNGVASPSVTIATATPNRSFVIATSASPASSITVDAAGQFAQFGPDLVAPSVQHAGTNNWLDLPVGAQTLTISRSSGDWAGTLAYTPAWL